MARRTTKPTSSTAAGSKPRRTPTTAEAVATDTPAVEPGAERAGKGGYRLVIVESPAKAKTIAKYLGTGYKVEASKGHIRDLPKRAPKGTKQPVPGVDLEHDFEPSYEVSEDRRKQVSDLKKLAKGASEIWFATDLDREGEAIAWHLTEILGVDPLQAKRVEFDEITRSAILKAFSEPRPINMRRVDAQQARRILDRIVGYMVSPVLWKKVAGGLSAGRVQSVALRLIVDREAEIRAFEPDEYWKVEAAMTPEPAKAASLATSWSAFMAPTVARGKGPTVKEQTHWLAERNGLECELIELAGARFELGREVPKEQVSEVDPRSGKRVQRARPIPQSQSNPNFYDAGESLAQRVQAVAEAVGLENVRIDLDVLPAEDELAAASADPRAKEAPKGFARWVRTVRGAIGAGVRYRVRTVETSGTSSKPRAPFITSTLQSSASYSLNFGTDKTMRVAQALYQGVNVPGEGLVGLITYMRTDSTSLSGEALSAAREFIAEKFGARYLPEKPRFYGSSNKSAQEAHEAIRPTNVRRTPEMMRGALAEDDLKLYTLIWQRFVACQMTDAQYDSTTALLERSDRATGAIFRASGRVQTFDGYTATGLRGESDDQELPAMKAGQEMAPFWMDPQQKFTSPPPRFNEASLVKRLEEEGIGRPSTYASIINTIEARGYVHQESRAFYATDIGIAVCDFLVEPFRDSFMDAGYTRRIEEELDEIAEGKTRWRQMLREFYGPFKMVVDELRDADHTKAKGKPSPYACPVCGRRCEYRLGKTGTFLSCTGFSIKVKAPESEETGSGARARRSAGAGAGAATKTKAKSRARKPKEVPACNYAAPVNRQGRPLLPEKVDILCPVDGAPMVRRSGRFGEFLTSENRETEFVLNLDKKRGIKFPAPPPLLTELPCPKCASPMNLRNGKRGPWLGCSAFPKCRGRESWAKVPEAVRTQLERDLAAHEAKQQTFVITDLAGKPIKEGTPIDALSIPGGEAKLALHPEYQKEKTRRA